MRMILKQRKRKSLKTAKRLPVMRILKSFKKTRIMFLPSRVFAFNEIGESEPLSTAKAIVAKNQYSKWKPF